MALLQKTTLESGWRFKETGKPDSESAPVARVPTNVHLDLLDNGLIPDPFVGTNELDVEWVGERSWTYQTEFASPQTPAGASAHLIFEGLDTFAKVFLNETVILESDNMFLSHRIDITKYLRAGSGLNSLVIEFDAALIRGRQLAEEHPEHRFACFNGESSRVAVRKAQYHWGWDWGPVLMTAGPWRPVILEVSVARINRVNVDYEIARDLRSSTGSITVQTDGRCSKAVCTLTYQGAAVATVTGAIDQQGVARLDFSLDKVHLWYPAGYGEQSLYSIQVDIFQDDIIVDTYQQTTGFRMIELVQEPDSAGESFFFRINGVDIFCGGSCWIPADSLPPRVSPEKYRSWLELMIEGRQNMTRVWGGGIYEEDVFYELCDELGILVWQDFMFACGNYPAWPAFRESVALEATQNVRRLRHHPSVVVYAGNNEDYQVAEELKLEYDRESKDPDQWLRDEFPARYYYEHLLPDIVARESPAVPYWPGSPFSKKGLSSDATNGDIHQWNVWHGTQEKYQRYEQIGGRFNSEFGLAAFPQIETIRSFTLDESQLYAQSQTLDFHNKADGHERRIATYIGENFRPSANLETHIYLTQLAQSEAMAYAYRGFRRQWGEDRFCGGALVWQMNDTWPGTSWSLVDYHLRRKGAFYAVARALRPVIVGVQREHNDWSVIHARPAKTSSYKLWVASSLLEEATVDLELRFVSIRSGEDIQEPVTRRGCAVKANGTTVVFSGSIDNTATEPHVLHARIIQGGKVISRDVDWPQPLKYLDLSNRGVEITKSDNAYTVTAARPTKALVIEEKDGTTLSDNWVDVVPGDGQTIQVSGHTVNNLRSVHLGSAEGGFA